MNTTPSSPLPAAGDRALVLGGGGSTGNAWLIGVIAGLFEAGLDVTTADLTIGTSAGSTAAARLAGATPTELFGAILATAPGQRTGPVGSDRGRAAASRLPGQRWPRRTCSSRPSMPRPVNPSCSTAKAGSTCWTP